LKDEGMRENENKDPKNPDEYPIAVAHLI